MVISIKKNGFALLELLLVVAILAILASLVLPRVLNSTVSNEAKENKESATSVLFFTEAREILRGAKDEYLVNSIFNSNGKNTVYAKVNGQECESHLSSIKENINYYVEFDKEGNVLKYFVNDGVWLYFYDSAITGNYLNVTDINDSDFVKYEENINNYSVSCTSFERK